MSKKLQKKITNKLEQLQTLINQIEEVQSIDPDDPATWDADTLYNLIELLKAILQILEDKKSKPINFSLTSGEETISERGLCSLVDSYQEEEDE